MINHFYIMNNNYLHSILFYQTNKSFYFINSSFKFLFKKNIKIYLKSRKFKIDKIISDFTYAEIIYYSDKSNLFKIKKEIKDKMLAFNIDNFPYHYPIENRDFINTLYDVFGKNIDDFIEIKNINNQIYYYFNIKFYDFTFDQHFLSKLKKINKNYVLDVPTDIHSLSDLYLYVKFYHNKLILA